MPFHLPGSKPPEDSQLAQAAMQAALNMQGEKEHLATKAELQKLRADFLEKVISRAEFLAILVPTCIAAFIAVASYFTGIWQWQKEAETSKSQKEDKQQGG